MSKRDWTVKGVKTFVGTEGHGFNASLYFRGKRVAFVYDDASGGPAVFNWKDREAEKAMQALCDAAEPCKGVSMGPDLLVSVLVDEYEDNRRLRRHCKTKVLFRAPGDPDGEFRAFKTPFTRQIVDHIHKEYGPKTEIVNFRFSTPM